MMEMQSRPSFQDTLIFYSRNEQVNFAQLFTDNIADSAVVVEDHEGALAKEESFSPVKVQAIATTTMSTVGGLDYLQGGQHMVPNMQSFTKGNDIYYK